jgi:hypothetical protein
VVGAFRALARPRALRLEARPQNLSPLPSHTWKLAGDPESDCTFTPHFSGSSPNALSARSWHSVSAWSMNSLPP